MRVCVVGRDYGGLGRVMMEVVDSMHVGQSMESWSDVGRCRNTSRVRGDTSRCAALDKVEPELVGLPGKDLARDAMRRLQFVVHAAG